MFKAVPEQREATGDIQTEWASDRIPRRAIPAQAGTQKAVPSRIAAHLSRRVFGRRGTPPTRAPAVALRIPGRETAESMSAPARPASRALSAMLLAGLCSWKAKAK